MVNVPLTAEESEVLEKIARTKNISKEKVMIQGLRLLQVFNELFDAGKITIHDEGPSEGENEE